jgi:hypothetical protein
MTMEIPLRQCKITKLQPLYTVKFGNDSNIDVNGRLEIINGQQLMGRIMEQLMGTIMETIMDKMDKIRQT